MSLLPSIFSHKYEESRVWVKLGFLRSVSVSNSPSDGLVNQCALLSRSMLGSKDSAGETMDINRGIPPSVQSEGVTSGRQEKYWVCFL